MDIKRKVTYETEINGKKYGLRFIKQTNVPGFSHKVIIATGDLIVAKDWLGADFRPGLKSAEFFFEKHKAQLI